MDNMKDLQELYETISRAISTANEKIRNAGGKLSSGDAEFIERLTHSLKSVKGVMKMEEEAEMDDGYSRGGDGYSGRTYHMPYDGGYSRGRGRYAKRDSMGRYSSDGYSGHGDMIDELHDLMNKAPDESTRQEFQRLIDKMERH